MTSEPRAIFAPAKINLALHVTGQRADGYHTLDSLVVFADIGDRLWIEPSTKTTLRVIGPFAAGVPDDARNLVWRAADHAGRTCAITLEKNLPHGAGIGGGSSDAAAVLRFFGTDENAISLGADVPVCLASTTQRMRGAGEDITPVSGLPPLFAVLVNPGHHVPTPQIFQALRNKDNAPLPAEIPVFQTVASFCAWLAVTRNDLQQPAIEKATAITDVLDALGKCDGANFVRMSGSGSTCFALFDTPEMAQSAAHQLTRAHADWWINACRLG